MRGRQGPARPTVSARTSSFWIGLFTGLMIALIATELWSSAADPDIEQYREVRDFVRESFVREVSNGELLDHALHGMLAGLDEYSRYYDPEEALALQRETGGRYQGIGCYFRPPASDGQILFTLAASPAAEAGLRVGDRILAVDGHPFADLSRAELQGLLREPEAGSVQLEVRGLDGDERSLEVRPRSLVDPTVRHAYMVDDTRRIGYIAILSFSRETPAEFDRCFAFLEERGMQALVLDLRRNYGGVLASAVKVAQRFVPSGLIVSTEGRGEPEEYFADATEARHQGFPLVVLVDGDSASASEVLAGALQDHRAAIVIGSPTFGKGMVQTIRSFDRGAEVVAKITSSYYYSPTHRNFERSVYPERDFGILPDIEVPIDELERQVIHRHLQTHSPPVDAIPRIEAWQEQAGEVWLSPHPPDAQLDAVVELLAGSRPGPHPARGNG